MAQYGKAPFLECSTKGDRRFSAFCARIKGRRNASIEELYQAFKIFPDGSTGLNWRQAKGRVAVNAQEASAFYDLLWCEYIGENEHLHTTIMDATGLSDMFAKSSGVNQAKTLWMIRDMLIDHYREEEVS